MNLDPVQASDELDEALARDVRNLRKFSRGTRTMTYLVAALALFGAWMALRVDRNTREINQTQAALRVFCNGTNANNREARDQFLEKFGTLVPDPQQLTDFADVAWPQRDCSQVTAITDPPTSTTTIP